MARREPKTRPQPFERPAQTSALFPHPFREVFAKWWSVELRFTRSLTTRETRTLAEAFNGWGRGGDDFVGTDGGVWGQWWNSFPGMDDEIWLRDVLKKIGVPAKVRAAPYGRDCPGEGCLAAESDEPNHRCPLGQSIAGDPVFTEADWIVIDPGAVAGG